MLHDPANLVARAAGIAGSQPGGKPPSLDADRDGKEAALRIVFDPMASFDSKMRAFTIAVEMVSKNKSREAAEADVEGEE